ncbi:MAG: hypothetical protein PHX83_10190 [Acidobacteriia bacterium]|nr:hypothetical protein [Terriglobia bacterium]
MTSRVPNLLEHWANFYPTHERISLKTQKSSSRMALAALVFVLSSFLLPALSLQAAGICKQRPSCDGDHPPVYATANKAVHFAVGPFTVDTTNDTHDSNTADGLCNDGTGHCSLRAAIEQADASGGTTTINIPAGTYNLSLGEIQFGNNVQNITLNGTGTSSNTIINMTNTGTDRIFLIDPPGTNANVVTTIQHLKFTGGSLSSDSFGGGAILGGGPSNSLTITDCVFDSNQVPAGNGTGGAINFSGGGTLSISSSTFTNNSDVDTTNTGGGAVFYFLQAFVNLTGSLSITDSTFNNNSTTAPSSGPGGGGALGIQIQGANTGETWSATVHNNTFTNNAASAGFGGAIYVEDAFGSSHTDAINLNRFNGNTASAGGAGLDYQSDASSVDATKNWWSCNVDPSTAPTGCDAAKTSGSGGVGSLTVSPWIVLKTTSSPSAVNYGASTTLTASFLQDSNGGSLTTANISTLIGLPVTWANAAHGTLSSQQTTIQSNGKATATFTAGSTSADCSPAVTGKAEAKVDGIPNGDSIATGTVTINCPDLTATKTNNVSGATQLANGGSCGPQCWTWTLTGANGGAGFATYANGQTIISDNLPNSNISYGSVAENNVSGVTGTISCGIDGSSNLTCTANGTVVINSGGSFTASFVATPTAVATYSNPRSAGSCAIDPNNDIPETSDSNNSCSNSVNVTAPDLTITKSNNVSGATTLGNNWTWKLHVANSSASATATFLNGQTIVTDDLDNSGNLSYGTPSAGNGTNITNIANISCSVTSNTLTCSATGTVVVGTSGSFDVTFTSTPSAIGTFTNPRSGGGCAVDPSNVVPETNEANNNCNSDSVTVTAPDLTISKANNVSGSVTVGQGWNWTLTSSNTGNSGAIFTPGTTILQDDLDNSGGVSYGTPTVANVTSVTNSGSIQCAINGGQTLTCTANGSTVTVGTTTGKFDVVVPVTSISVGSYTNPRAAGICRVDPNNSVVESNESNNDCASNSVTVRPLPPTISKSFGASTVPLNGTTSLGFTISNPNASTGLTGVAFSDTLPAGLTVADSSASQCNGTLTTTHSTGVISLSGGSVALTGHCSFSVTITGTTAGVKDNTTGNVSSTESGAGTTSNTATITVVAPPTIAKAFSPTSIPSGGTSTITFTLTNPNSGVALSGVGFTDTFPTGMQVVSPPNAVTNCGGTFAPSAGDTSLTFSGGSLAASPKRATSNTALTSCTITVDVTSSTAGSSNNTTGAISSTEGGTGTTSNTATLTVEAPPFIQKSFAACVVPPSGMVNWWPGDGNANDIQGANNGTLQAGATFAAGEVGQAFSFNGSDQYVDVDSVALASTFTIDAWIKPTSLANQMIFSKAGSTLAVTDYYLFVDNTGVLQGFVQSGTNIFTVYFTNSPAVVAGSLQHIAMTYDGSAGADQKIHFYVNGVNAPAAHNSTFDAGGTPQNTGGGSTKIGSSGTAGRSFPFTGLIDEVEVFNRALSQPEIQSIYNAGSAGKCKVTPAIALNGTVPLTFTLINPAANTVAETDVAFTDTLPSGLQVGATPGVVNNCGGTFTPSAGDTTLSFTGGTINAAAKRARSAVQSNTCTITLNVKGTTSGVKNNTTGAISSTNGGTGATSNTATLTVASPPTLSKSFNPTQIPLNGTSTLTFTITNPNSSLALSGIAFSDSLPSGLQVGSPTGISATCTGTWNATAGDTTLNFSGGSLAASSSCTLQVNIQGTTAGVKNNTTGAISSNESGTGATSNTATITVVAPPTIAKAFSPTSIPAGGTSTITFTLTNPNSGVALSGVGFTDTFPTGMQVAATPNAVTNCSGTFTPAGGDTSLTFSGGTISAAPKRATSSIVSGTCTITVDVKGTTAGSKSNTTGAITSTEGGTGTTSNTAILTVVAPPSIAKAFSPTTIAVNGTSTLTFTLTNPSANTVQETGVAFSDSLPSGVQVAATPSASSGCGGTFAPSAGDTTLNFSGGTINTATKRAGPRTAANICTISVSVTGTTSGVKNNTTGAISSTNGGTGATSNTATLTVASPPALSKSFNPTQIPLNGTSTLTFTITNPNSSLALTGIAFSDSLPSGLQVASTPGASNTCNGTFAPAASDTTLNFSGGTLAASSSCTLQVNIQGTTAGVKNNTTGNVSSTESGAGTTSNTATITVVAPPTIAKAFSPTSIPLNGTSTITFTLTNPNSGVALSGVGFTDSFPSGMQVAATPNAVTNCSGTFTPAAGDTSLTFSGGAISAAPKRATSNIVSGTCTITVDVTGTTAGSKSNTTGAISSTEGGTGTTSNTATLTVVAPPFIQKSFASCVTPPSGMVSWWPGDGNTNDIVGSNNGTLQGGATFAAGEVGQAFSLNGTTADVFVPSSSSLNVGTGNGLTIDALIAPTDLTANHPIVEYSATSGSPQIGVHLWVNGPQVLFANLRDTSGTSHIISSGSVITLSAFQHVAVTYDKSDGVHGYATLYRNGVVIAGPTDLGLFTPKTDVDLYLGARVSNDFHNGNGARFQGLLDEVEVFNRALSQPEIQMIYNAGSAGKCKASPTIAVNGTAPLSFTITNPAANTTAENGVAFSDTLPTGLTVANSTSSVCGGTLTTTNPTGISLTGATINTSSQCQFSVTVTGAASGQYTNVTGAVSSTNGGTGNTASANLTVASPPTIAKAFGAAAIPLNGTSTLTFTIQNPNSGIALTGISFSDSLPSGLQVAATPGASDTCGGTFAPAASDTTLNFSGGSLAASSSCMLEVSIQGTTAGVKNNTSGAISANESGAGTTSNTATLTVVAPPTIAKAFNPSSSIPLNGTATLTFTITNPNTTAAGDLTGVAFSDTLPSTTGKLVVAPTPNVTNTCNGTVTATAGTGVISLSGGSVAHNSSCTLSVDVKGTAAGNAANTTGAITSTEGGTGTTSNTATITVVAPPTISKAFNPTLVAVNATSTLTFTLANPSANTVAESGVAFTDNFPAGLQVASPNGLVNGCGGTATAVAASSTVTLTGGTIATSSNCTITVNVTPVTAGDKTNTTGPVSSTNGGTGAASNTAVLAVEQADLQITKAGSAPTPLVGSTLIYTVTVTNLGPTTATGASWTDTLPSAMTFGSINNPAGWACSVTSGVVTCTKATAMAIHEVDSFTVVVTVNCGQADGTVVNNTARVTFPGTDPNPANNSATAPVTVSNPAATLSPSSVLFRSRGGMGSVQVGATSSCPWTAVSNDAFITVTSAASGTGLGPVTYTVGENLGSTTRSGSMTIAGQKFMVTQTAVSTDNSQAGCGVQGDGDCSFSTPGTGGNVEAGYATVQSSSGKSGSSDAVLNQLYGTAVFSLTQDNAVVSEAGVPVVTPTTSAEIFIDYRTNVQFKGSGLDAGVISINTGVAMVNVGTLAAHLTFTLQDATGAVTLATGHAVIPAGNHRALFIDQLSQMAPDFVFPSNFGTATKFGTLTITSDQAIDFVALRLTINQRGETLMTTTPVADLTAAATNAVANFPQVADGGSFTTTLVLLNTTNAVETGQVNLYRDDGTALLVHRVGDPAGSMSTFRYTIPVGGLYRLETDGAPAGINAGAMQVVPDAGTMTPQGAGVFRFAPIGVEVGSQIVVSESGVPAAIPTTHGLIYVDQANNHMTGLALEAPTSTPVHVTLRALEADGSTVVGSGSVDLVGHGHAARFVQEFITGLPAGFTGVLDLAATTPFAAVTLRGLTNSRGEFLLTTFPVADFARNAPVPILFPQIADGGGFRTQIILLNTASTPQNVLILFFGDDGLPLDVAK